MTYLLREVRLPIGIRTTIVTALFSLTVAESVGAQPLPANVLPSGVILTTGQSNQARARSTSNVGCDPATTDCGWLQILLVDISDDNRADLCGFYGVAPRTTGGTARVHFGCLLASTNDLGTFTDGFREALPLSSAAQALPPAALPHTRKIHAIDLSMDGKPDHVCLRMADGVGCVKFGGGQFDQQLLRVLDNFSDRNGWHTPAHGETVGFSVLDGVPAACGRGVAGVHCFKWNSSARLFSIPIEVQPSFADRHGWNQRPYFSTLNYVDINGDGHGDICGRGSAGIVCATYLPGANRFSDATWWATQFRDADGWSQTGFYESLQFLDLNRDGKTDICGRGHHGLFCGVSNGQQFLYATNPTPATTEIRAGLGNALPSGEGAPFVLDIDRGQVTPMPSYCERVRRSDGKFEIKCVRSKMAAGVVAMPSFCPLGQRALLNNSFRNIVMGRLTGRDGWNLCWIDDNQRPGGYRGDVWCQRSLDMASPTSPCGY
ncbi:MAG TPA: VCBS repeat-containing protein [Rhodocyclaceae bacterium]|nr:VCBS repeat-containing protein [Rhodocyclaceae bacterium]